MLGLTYSGLFSLGANFLNGEFSLAINFPDLEIHDPYY